MSDTTMEPYRLTACQALAKFQSGTLTVEDYAKSLLARIEARDPVVKAWAYLNPDLVLAEAKKLDQIPPEKRGPLHGIAIGVKDVIYTKDMPTQHNSPIYKDDAPALDAASIMILRAAGALILGKTHTTEFAATATGPPTCNPHDPARTPGGSSSGSGAAVGDFQCPLALGTQTGGSTIRPGSFNGIYAMKPTWGAISREGQKMYAVMFDTLGLYSRSAEDMQLLTSVLGVEDDEAPTPFKVEGARFAVIKTPFWDEFAGKGTKAAMKKAVELLKAHGATVTEQEDLDVPAELENIGRWHRTVMDTDGRSAFLPDYRVSGRDAIGPSLAGHVENKNKHTRVAQLEANDGIAALRPKMDAIVGSFDAVLCPSVVDEAPLGQTSTGSAVFNSMWTAFHNPVVNVPGFEGENGLPIGLSLVGGRYRDQHLLAVTEEVGKIFEVEGGWTRKL